MICRKTGCLAALILLFLGSAAFAPGFEPAGPVDVEVQAAAAVMVEFETGAVLYEKNPDMRIPPASLTKLMTVHLLLKEVGTGTLNLDDEIPIPEAAWWTNLPPGSSLMFLGPAQTVTLRELIWGLTVSSGNDAAVAAAHLVSGGLGPFVELMNREAQSFGLEDTRFADASGLSAESTTTAEDFAEFCRLYITLHPDALDLFHAVEEFTYPKDLNAAVPGRLHAVTQGNRNVLLGEYQGLDGLKTGYIDESGYNLAATAERGGMRLITVLLGGTGETHPLGRRRIADDAVKLFDYGYNEFTMVRPKRISLEPVRVWKGRSDEAVPVPGEAVLAVVPKRSVPLIETRIEYDGPVVAPVPYRKPLGRIILYIEGNEVARFPLVAERRIEAAGPSKRWAHGIALFFRRIFGR